MPWEVDDLFVSYEGFYLQLLNESYHLYVELQR